MRLLRLLISNVDLENKRRCLFIGFEECSIRQGSLTYFYWYFCGHLQSFICILIFIRNSIIVVICEAVWSKALSGTFCHTSRRTEWQASCSTFAVFILPALFIYYILTVSARLLCWKSSWNYSNFLFLYFTLIITSINFTARDVNALV